jgi:hypothetical protein
MLQIFVSELNVLRKEASCKKNKTPKQKKSMTRLKFTFFQISNSMRKRAVVGSDAPTHDGEIFDVTSASQSPCGDG